MRAEMIHSKGEPGNERKDEERKTERKKKTYNTSQEGQKDKEVKVTVTIFFRGSELACKHSHNSITKQRQLTGRKKIRKRERKKDLGASADDAALFPSTGDPQQEATGLCDCISSPYEQRGRTESKKKVNILKAFPALFVEQCGTVALHNIEG